jgi:hypothetical protein
MRVALVNGLYARHTIPAGHRVPAGSLTRRPKRRAASANNGQPRIIVIRGGGGAPKRRRARNGLIMPNASMQPFANAAMLPNRRRRRRYSNGMGMGGGKIQRAFFDTLGASGASAGAFYLNKMGIARIGTTAAGADTENGIWWRSIVRVGLAGLGLMMWPGLYSHSFAGAVQYPMWREIDRKVSGTTTAPSATAAYITEAEAALDDVLDDLYR